MFTGLEWLALQSNQINQIDAAAFKDLKSLQILWLYDNQIKAIESESFARALIFLNINNRK